VSKLAFYSKVFKTVEIETTFYEYPPKAMIQACARVTPSDFVFSVRVPRLVTHDKRLDVQRGAGRDFMGFLFDLRQLEDSGKLGPLIFQLPHDFAYEDGLGRLIDFLGSLPADLRFAVEFRNKSWFREETWDLLRQCKVANVILDAPTLPVQNIVTADFAVIRWQGRGKETWTDYGYGGAELDEWVPRVREIERRVKDVYGYFCNHPRGNAVADCLRMMERRGVASEAQKEIASAAQRAIRSKAARHAGPRGPGPAVEGR
jgi:uncharacterized protein YecE (DUF72 family)